MTDDPAWWSANRMASAIRSREVSSRELLEYFADRIGRLDEAINSVVRWDLERATAAAARPTKRWPRGRGWGRCTVCP